MVPKNITPPSPPSGASERNNQSYRTMLAACKTQGMQLHLDEVATAVVTGRVPFSFSIEPVGTAPRTSAVIVA
jgi:hypothetical protein